MKKVLITGINGQDGSYLARLLIRKGYEVHGLRRRSSIFNSERIDDLIKEELGNKLFLHFGDMTDSSSIYRIIGSIEPDEIYNLAAQSHVGVSFETPEYTANADGLGVLRVLEAIRQLDLINKTRFYQASTSEIFGNQPSPQNEGTPFTPRSPYGVAKLYGHWITVNYRESYNMYACNGILFNHESPLRGETFVTQKIVNGLVSIVNGTNDRPLLLGNLSAERDWGYAPEYVEMMWKMLQQNKAEDFVIATGRTLSVRSFAEKVAVELGVKIDWKGEGQKEVGYISGKVAVKVSPDYYRPAEVDKLLGDASRARNILGWESHTTVEQLISLMVSKAQNKKTHGR